MAKEKAVDVSETDELPLGSCVRLVRQQRKVRLSKMAREIDYSKGHLSRVENNVVAPSDELLEKIARYLEISVRDLKEAPISLSAPENAQRNSARRMGFVLGAPPISTEKNEDNYKARKRAIGERIERLLKMAHLSEEEEEMIEERIAAITSELLKLVKDARRKS